MTRATFFKHFELLADQPDAVARMRELVWQFAVQGKLLSQNPKDESATRLVEQIREQKSRLTKAGKIRKTPLLPPIEESDHHFKIPPSWAWIHLNDIGDWGSGSTPERGRSEFYGGDIPWLKSGELNDGYVAKAEEHLTKLALEKCSLRLNQPGDVLIAMYGATVGKVAILEIEATTNQAVCACTCFDGVFNRYLFLLLKAYKQRFIDESAGAAQPNFSKDKIIRTIAPLSPLAEQRRIVAKVDELMALCDELEQRQQARQHASGLLQQSALHHLLAAREPHTFAAAWQRVRDHFHLLHDTPDALPQLRNTILTLAVQGRLTNKAVEFSIEGGYWLLPKSWKWTKVEDVGRVQLGRQRAPQYHNGPNMRPYLRVQNVYESRLDLSDVKEMEFSATDFEKYRLEPNDILLNEGQSAELVGRPAIYRGEVPGACFQNTLVRFQVGPNLTPEFALVVFRAYMHGGRFTGKSVQTTNIAHLGAGRFARMLFPLPPLAEQKRIVARVEGLLRGCDTLEAQLHQTRTLGANLLISTLHHLLAA